MLLGEGMGVFAALEVLGTPAIFLVQRVGAYLTAAGVLPFAVWVDTLLWICLLYTSPSPRDLH